MIDFNTIINQNQGEFKDRNFKSYSKHKIKELRRFFYSYNMTKTQKINSQHIEQQQ